MVQNMKNVEKALMSLMWKGEKLNPDVPSNNYWDDWVEYQVYQNAVIVSTGCTNDYGRNFSNDNHTVILKSQLPNWLARKLYLSRDAEVENRNLYWNPSTESYSWKAL